MSNPETLKPLNTRPEEERKAIASNGGKASAKERLRKKAGRKAEKLS